MTSGRPSLLRSARATALVVSVPVNVDAAVVANGQMPVGSGLDDGGFWPR